ncbi:unnamed protein product [Paramecium sonneborni]|uniref:EGF-like domain-containing protein n=1 Tax=Paramecium sonneborni TaxID=65129 RepID=A0A8S1NN92_9CILI|nr:unnamed protein product [Paramecium sonneborni]
MPVNFQCVCNDGYYTDGSNQCQICNSPCSECEDNADKCIGCISTFTLSQSIQNKCVCSSGYYQVNPTTCQQCIAPCLTCEQNQNHCLSCVDVNQELNELNLCVCKTGWIINTNGITCIQCQLPCLDCIQTINKCTSCQDQQYQSPDSCLCQSGWIYDNNYFCIPCLQPCQTCQISTSQCLTCLDDNHIINNLSQCVCKPTYYSDSLITCAKCNQPCYECDSNGCINCLDINSILDSDHNCVCKSGYVNYGIQCLQCQKPCSSCINTVDKCLTCFDINQTIKNFQCICNEGFLMKGQICCDQYCNDCQAIDNCGQCMKGYFVSSNNRCLQCIDNCDFCYNQTNCQLCQFGYFLNQQTQCESCISNCKICNNSSNCDLCFDGFYILDYKCEKCNQNCQTCNEQASNCITCRSNQVINSNNQCVCIVGYFEQFNVCLQCDYPCKACSSFTICEECLMLSNLYLDENFQCKCSRGYFWNQTNCLQCYKKCLTCFDNQFNCLSCDQNQHRILINNKCQCDQNYFESEDGYCISCFDTLGKSQKNCKYSNCYDSIWTYGEECDDGNFVNRDGCSNCKIDLNYSCNNIILKPSKCFQCSSNCIKCELNPLTNKSSCIKCQIGYFLDKNDCVECSINCFECIDQAYNCISCKFPQQKNLKCQICQSDSGYYSDDIKGICLNNCGDSIKVKEEECDDGNLIKGDGCDDQCNLEEQYIFVNGQSIIPTYPKPTLKSIGDTQIYSVIRLFKLSYDTPIIINDNFQIKDYLSINISNQNIIKLIDQPFELSQEITQINEFNLSKLNLIINITFQRDSQDEILLIKFLNSSVIYSNDGYSQIEKEVSCSIPKVIYIDDGTITQVKITSESNTYMLYFICVMCGGSILFGGFEVFFNLLDTLQMLSYLKYINTPMPYNLQIYFELFRFAQFNFIQKIFDFSGFIESILDINHLKRIPTKIAADNLTSLFIINASTIITVWISLFAIYSIARIVPKILQSIKCKFYSDNESQNQWLIQFGVYYLTIKYFINKLCFIIVSEFFFSGILRVHMTTAYDFSFSIILQLYALQPYSSNIFINLSSILACMATIIYISSIYFVIMISQMKKYSLNSKQIQTKYGSVFEGIIINQFSKYFNALLLIKKLIFMVLLIFSYEFPTLQACSITFLSISTTLFQILFCPLKDKIEYFKQLLCEVSVTLTLLGLTILTYDFELEYFQYKTRQYIGWGCIFFMTSILFIQLVIDSFQQWKFLYYKYKQIRKIAQSIFRIFKKKNQVTAPSNIFQ